jgi:hypothetical protein
MGIFGKFFGKKKKSLERGTALRITEDLILRGHCELCGKQATRESLQLMAGNDFYICPKCGLMFCNNCYFRLPLTSSPGYGMCPKCRVQVQRTIPGLYGEQSGTWWARRRFLTVVDKISEQKIRIFLSIIKDTHLTGKIKKSRGAMFISLAKNYAGKNNINLNFK